jgi:hypothetical protein
MQCVAGRIDDRHGVGGLVRRVHAVAARDGNIRSPPRGLLGIGMDRKNKEYQAESFFHAIPLHSRWSDACPGLADSAARCVSHSCISVISDC